MFQFSIYTMDTWYYTHFQSFFTFYTTFSNPCSMVPSTTFPNPRRFRKRQEIVKWTSRCRSCFHRPKCWVPWHSIVFAPVLPPCWWTLELIFWRVHESHEFEFFFCGKENTRHIGQKKVNIKIFFQQHQVLDCNLQKRSDTILESREHGANFDLSLFGLQIGGLENFHLFYGLWVILIILLRFSTTKIACLLENV